MDKDHDHNFRSPRADSFYDSVSDDALPTRRRFDDVDDVHDDGMMAITPDYDDDDAIIKCICGFGKGYDDDDATSCEKCETWQHNLCYFHIHRRALPKDGDTFLCVDCDSSLDVDQNLAASRMRRKLQILDNIADRISELKCEMEMREHELETLENQLASVESDLYTNGPLLDVEGTDEAHDILDGMHDEWLLLKQDILRTIDECDAIRIRIEDLEDDQARVKRNEPTFAEELKAYQEKMRAAPRLWTTASALKSAACYQYAMPPILTTKTAAAVQSPSLATTRVTEQGKVARPRKKRRRIG